MDNFRVRVSGAFGAVPDGVEFDFSPGYRTLVGANNAGKSSLLQALYSEVISRSGSAVTRSVWIPPDRQWTTGTTQVGEETLEKFNKNVQSILGMRQPLTYQNGPRINSSQLAQVLLNHTNFLKQNQRLNTLLESLGFPVMDLSGPQAMTFDSVAAHFQGSGLRSLLPILAALTDDQLEVILIDEPEISLDPRLLRGLRHVLEEAAMTRSILVATHSHLLLNRSNPEMNYRVSRSSRVQVRALEGQHELLDVAFDLLGNDPEDLFLPSAFLLVEGASDQAVVERVVEIRAGSDSQLKVLSARGITEVPGLHTSIQQLLLPLIAGESAYKTRVVTLVDKPRADDVGAQRAAAVLAKELGERAFVLPETSMEEYLPSEFYGRVQLNKADVLSDLESHGGDYKAAAILKRNVARSIARALVEDDLDQIPEITAFVDHALRLAGGQSVLTSNP